MRANSNFGGPKQRQNRLLPPDRSPQYKNQKTGTINTNLLSSPKTNNTQSTSLMGQSRKSSQLTDETTKVSCRKQADPIPGTKDDVRIMDTSNSSCLTFVCTPTKSNDTQPPKLPSTNYTSHSNEKNYITTTTANLDVKVNSETLVSNHPSTNSGYNTSYCTTVVKSKSEW